MTKAEIPEKLDWMINRSVEIFMENQNHLWLDEDCPRIKDLCGRCESEDCHCRCDPGLCERASGVCGDCRECFERCWRDERDLILKDVEVVDRRGLFLALDERLDSGAADKVLRKFAKLSDHKVALWLEHRGLARYVDIYPVGDGKFALDYNHVFAGV